MTIQFHPPFTKETFAQMVKSWMDIPNRNECGSVLNLAKRDQLYRVKQFQENKQVVKKFLRQYNNYQFLFLDLTSEMIEDPIDAASYLEKNRNKQKQLLLFVLGADRLLIDRKEVLSYLDSLYTNTSIFIIYLLQKNITLPRYTKEFSQYTTLYQNIKVFSLLGLADTKEFIKQMEQRFHILFPSSIVKSILSECNGFLWLIKQACRHFSQTHDRQTLFSNEGMMLRLSVIYNEFSPEEKVVLTKIVRKEKQYSNDEQHIVNYFLKTRLVSKRIKTYYITIPLLEKYIKQQITKNSNIKINERGEIIINNVTVNSVFSKRERKLCLFFIRNPNIVISRDKTAEIIWCDNYHENYTDWALDQLIKRLRRKFDSIGIGSQIIKTVKNQGFLYQIAYGK